MKKINENEQCNHLGIHDGVLQQEDETPTITGLDFTVETGDDPLSVIVTPSTRMELKIF